MIDFKTKYKDINQLDKFMDSDNPEDTIKYIKYLLQWLKLNTDDFDNTIKSILDEK